MKAISRVSALAAVAFLISHANASAQNWGRPQTPQSGACFYEDINYGGDYFCTNAGTNNPVVAYRLNNRISSIRLFGNAEVTVYMDPNYQGRSRTFGSDIADLGRGGWNDRVSSFRVRSSGRGDTSWAGRWGRPATPSSGVCFYEHINFEGQYFCAREGDRVELVPEGTNDRISSIRIFGGAEVTVFRDRDFRGQSQHFEANVRDLRDSGWNDLLSSFRIDAPGFGRGNRGRGASVGRGSGGRGSGGLGSGQSVIGRMEWRGRVDNRVHLAVRGRSVEQRTMSGTALPDGNASFTSALPAAAVQVIVTKLSGRGTVRVVQQPSRLNDFTAVIEILDAGGGSQEYRIEVTWR